MLFKDKPFVMTTFVVGIILSSLVMFGVTACDNGLGPDNGVDNPVLSGTITITPNDNVSINTELTAIYSGSETVSYQWKKDGVNVGANSDKYTPAEAGSYTVTVSAAGYNSKTSAAVDVNDPSLSVLSGNITISPSSAVTGTELTATYSGNEPVDYQWRKDGVNVGMNSNKYRPSQAGNYTVTVSAEGYNSKTSVPVTVTGSNNPPENWPVANRWTKEILPESTATLDYSVASDGVCTITVGGVADPTKWHSSAHYLYTAAAGKSYIYVFEAWTESGTRDMSIQYYHDFDTGTSLMGSDITINTTKQQYTARGLIIPKDGARSLQFHCANQLGKFYVKVISITEYALEELPAADRWNKFVDSSSSATLDQFSVSSDGVAAITIGGTPELNGQNDIWRAWTIQAQYTYTSRANARYIYEIEAWKAPGSEDRTLHFQYYEDNDARIYLGTNITLTEERTTYTVRGEKLPNVRGQLDFHCADQIGTFYVKVLSIEEYEIGELTITNYSGKPGFAANNRVYGYAHIENNDEWLYLNFNSAQITGSSLTLDVYIYGENGERIPYTGNDTVAAGDLALQCQDGSEYRNKVPITFTNGKAAINFGSQMDLVSLGGTLTITNFSGSPGFTIGVNATFENSDLYLGSWSVQITGDTITIPVYFSSDNSTIITGNGTVAAGDLRFNVNGNDGDYYYYINKAPITFTDGIATIDFDSQMEKVFDRGTLTITNFSGPPGFTENSWFYVEGAYFENSELYLDFSSGQITDDTIIFEVYYSLLNKGNGTVAVGGLRLHVYGDDNYLYTNKVPITFTNGSATINFDSQMEGVFDRGTLTITNFSGPSGFTENSSVSVEEATFENSELYLNFSLEQITGDTIIFEVFYSSPNNGNGTVAVGDLRLYVYGDDNYLYTNKVPIIFTNGSAAVDFNTDMEAVDEDGEG